MHRTTSARRLALAWMGFCTALALAWLLLLAWAVVALVMWVTSK